MRIWHLGMAFGLAAFGVLSKPARNPQITDETSLRQVVASGSARLKRDVSIELSGPIRVTHDLTIEGKRNTRLSGAGQTRLFEVASGATLRLVGLTLANGSSTNGGAIYCDGGTVIIIDCTFSNNIARGFDGMAGQRGPMGIVGSNSVPAVPGGTGEGGTHATAGRGGAIFCRGTLIVTNAAFIRNTAQGGEGGNGGAGGDGPTYVQPGHGGNGGDGADAEGGAVYVEGNAVFSCAEFNWNFAASGRGGIGGQPGTNREHVYSRLMSGESGWTGNARGGAIACIGTNELQQCRFVSNYSLGINGRSGETVREAGPVRYQTGSNGRGGMDGGSAEGGAIWSFDSLRCVSTYFSNNAAAGGAGGNGAIGGHGYNGSYSADGGNGGNGGSGGPAAGGSICSKGALALFNSVIEQSWAISGDGGAGGGGGAGDGSARANDGGDGGASAISSGGALRHEGSLAISRSTFRGCASIAGRGGIGGVPGGALRFVAGYGEWGRTGDCTPASGGAIWSDGTNVLAECYVLGAWASGARGTNGGTRSASKINPAAGQHGNDGGPAHGAGAYLRGDSLIETSTFASNRCVAGVAGDGGAGGSSLYDFATGGSGGSGGEAQGAGIYGVGFLRVVHSTIGFNSSVSGNGGSGKIGGTAIINSARGAAGSGGNGGSAAGSGLFIASNSTALIEFCTFAGNSGTNGTAGLGGQAPGFPTGADGVPGTFEGSAVATAGGPIPVRNCIVANASASATLGSLEDLGGNLCSDNSCGFDASTSLQNTEPLLAQLQDNGGATPTMALLPGSPAIDAAVSPCAETDQRGYARSAGNSCDVGAFEFGAFPEDSPGSVRGRIVRHRGNEGVGEVCVLVGDQIVFTDRDGNFVCDELQTGRCVVRPMGQSLRFFPAQRRVSVRPGRPAQVRFHVRN